MEYSIDRFFRNNFNCFSVIEKGVVSSRICSI